MSKRSDTTSRERLVGELALDWRPKDRKTCVNLIAQRVGQGERQLHGFRVFSAGGRRWLALDVLEAAEFRNRSVMAFGSA